MAGNTTMQDIDDMKEETERVRKELYDRDIARGYCVRNLPKLPEVFTSDVLARTVTDLKPFLLGYARLILGAGDWVDIGDTTKLDAWNEDLAMVNMYSEGNTQIRSIEYLFAIASISKMTGDPVQFAQSVYEVAEITDRSLRVKPDDYNYDEMYDKYKGEYRQWKQENFGKQKVN